MSNWLERVNSDFIITLGDGKQFTPLWLLAEQEIEYVISQFEFPDVAGSLVKRGQPKGAKYKIEIFFEGENHLDTSDEFKISAADPRPWTINHPIYGSILVHPLSLLVDNSKYNTTKITVPVIETIEDVNPTSAVVPVDRIKSDKEKLDEVSANEFSVVDPPIADMKANNSDLYNEGAKVVKDNTASQNYFNSFNEANTAINNATAYPLSAIQKAQAVINAPSLFEQSVSQRMELLVNQFNILNTKILNISLNPTKSLYENNASTLISSMAVTIATPMENDYKSRNDVLSIASTFSTIYSSYVTTLGSISGSTGGSARSFVPSPAVNLLLNTLVNYTLSNLLIIALNAQQERIIYLEEDSNAILLAHRFYGLEVDDSTIDRFMLSNNIGLNEILNIKKGRKIVYYVENGG